MSDIKNRFCDYSKSLVLVLVFVAVLSLSLRFLFPLDIGITLIKHASWPLLIGILILSHQSSFVRLLDEVVKFVGKSYYRCGEKDYHPAQKDSKRIGGKAAMITNEKRISENMGNVCKNESSRLGSSFCEHQLIDRLQAEYGVPVYERQSIGVSSFYFDAVMEYKGVLYGVEIRGRPEHCNWERIFSDVQKAYDGFIPSQKKRFVFMVCLCGYDEKNELDIRDVERKYAFPTVIKYY